MLLLIMKFWQQCRPQIYVTMRYHFHLQEPVLAVVFPIPARRLLPGTVGLSVPCGAADSNKFIKGGAGYLEPRYFNANRLRDTDAYSSSRHAAGSGSRRIQSGNRVGHGIASSGCSPSKWRYLKEVFLLVLMIQPVLQILRYHIYIIQLIN